MGLLEELKTRTDNKCELCGNTNNLMTYDVGPDSTSTLKDSVLVCNTCKDQLDDVDKIEPNHWRCLNDTMWSQEPAVQVVVWRMLSKLKDEGWPADLLDMLYLEDDVLTWAKSGISSDLSEDSVKHIDSNGAALSAGDSVTLIKDLNVKGGGFTAKRGTAVRNISLVHDNAEQIEGRVEGQHIVILTKFVKKSS